MGTVLGSPLSTVLSDRLPVLLVAVPGFSSNRCSVKRGHDVGDLSLHTGRPRIGQGDRQSTSRLYSSSKRTTQTVAGLPAGRGKQQSRGDDDLLIHPLKSTLHLSIPRGVPIISHCSWDGGSPDAKRSVDDVFYSTSSANSIVFSRENSGIRVYSGLPT
jgi:hypothetical protein